MEREQDDRPKDWDDDDSWWQQLDDEQQRAEQEMRAAQRALREEVERVLTKIYRGLH